MPFSRGFSVVSFSSPSVLPVSGCDFRRETVQRSDMRGWSTHSSTWGSDWIEVAVPGCSSFRSHYWIPERLNSSVIPRVTVDYATVAGVFSHWSAGELGLTWDTHVTPKQGSLVTWKWVYCWDCCQFDAACPPVCTWSCPPFSLGSMLETNLQLVTEILEVAFSCSDGSVAAVETGCGGCDACTAAARLWVRDPGRSAPGWVTQI